MAILMQTIKKMNPGITLVDFAPTQTVDFDALLELGGADHRVSEGDIDAVALTEELAAEDADQLAAESVAATGGIA